MKQLTFILLVFILWGCSSNDGKSVAATVKDDGNSEIDLGEKAPAAKSKSKRIGNKNYKLQVLSALDFLKRKGTQIAESDEEALKKEVVVLLEISTPEGKDFFESADVTLPREEAIQYLMGEITQDISIFQSKKEYFPAGVNYERSPGEQHAVRVMFYFTDIIADKEMRIKFYDRILGAGIINFNIDK